MYLDYCMGSTLTNKMEKKKKKLLLRLNVINQGLAVAKPRTDEMHGSPCMHASSMASIMQLPSLTFPSNSTPPRPYKASIGHYEFRFIADRATSDGHGHSLLCSPPNPPCPGLLGLLPRHRPQLPPGGPDDQALRGLPRRPGVGPVRGLLQRRGRPEPDGHVSRRPLRGLQLPQVHRPAVPRRRPLTCCRPPTHVRGQPQLHPLLRRRLQQVITPLVS